MTSEERNRRMKYGHDVPRWWIPDFHNTHKRERDKEKSAASARQASDSGDELLKTAKFQATRQQLFEQQRRWAEQHCSEAAQGSRDKELCTTSEKYALKRRLRQRKLDDQKSRLNRDIRIVQTILAGFFVLIGGITGGLLGLVLGAAIGLVLISFRLEI
jgi:hypothetical protein